MEILRGAVNLIEKTNCIIGNTVKFLLLYMAVTLTIDVIARYAFDSPTVWIFEMCKHAMLYIGALGGGYTLMVNGHVKVDVIYSILSSKIRAVLDIVTSVLFFIFIAIMIWKCSELAISSCEHMEHSTTALGAPIYPMKVAVVVGAVLVLLQGIAKLFKDIILLITGEEQEYKTLN